MDDFDPFLLAGNFEDVFFSPGDLRPSGVFVLALTGSIGSTGSKKVYTSSSYEKKMGDQYVVLQAHNINPTSQTKQRYEKII